MSTLNINGGERRKHSRYLQTTLKSHAEMPFCTQCGKQPTTRGPNRRSISPTTKICNDCTDKQGNGDGSTVTNTSPTSVTLDPDTMLSELSVRDFSLWFKQEIDDVIQKKVDDATKDMVKDLEDKTKKLKTAQDDIKELKPKVNKITETLKETKKERDDLKKTTMNNLKYLEHHLKLTIC